jgi:small basic protein (TIGR04137 family)
VSIDKSLRRKNQLQRSRNVLTRGERIIKLTSEERWQEGRSPFGLPKVKVVKLVVKKAKKKEEKPAEGEAAAAGAEGTAAAATPAAAKPATPAAPAADKKRK